MNSINDRIVIQQSETNSETKSIKAVNETAKDLCKEVALADQYTLLIYEMPIYKGFEDILEYLPEDLRYTASFWRDWTKPALMKSIGKLRSFCTTYTSYFPELVEALSSGVITVASEKEYLQEYLGEILPQAKKSSKDLKSSIDLSKKFLNNVENNKDKLQSKVIPNIEKTFNRDQAKLAKIKNELEDVEFNIAHAQQQLITAMGGTIATGVGLGLSATSYIFRNQIQRAGAKIGEKITGLLPSAGKFASKITTAVSESAVGKAAAKVGGKVLPVLGVVFVLVDLAGLIASSIFWKKYQTKLKEYRKQESDLNMQIINVSADLKYLEGMSQDFSTLLEKTSTVATVFNKLNESWNSVYNSLDEINLKLKDVDTKLKKGTFLIKSKLIDINTEFSVLVNKLKQYELNFVLPIGYEDKSPIVDVDNEPQAKSVFFSMPPKLWMPNTLYNAYTRDNTPLENLK